MANTVKMYTSGATPPKANAVLVVLVSRIPPVALKVILYSITGGLKDGGGD